MRSDISISPKNIQPLDTGIGDGNSPGIHSNLLSLHRRIAVARRNRVSPENGIQDRDFAGLRIETATGPSGAIVSHGAVLQGHFSGVVDGGRGMAGFIVGEETTF